MEKCNIKMNINNTITSVNVMVTAIEECTEFEMQQLLNISFYSKLISDVCTINNIFIIILQYILV